MTVNTSTALQTTVPWQFSEAGTYSQWLWTTLDFTATVVRADGTWSWEVKTTAAVSLSAGHGQDFDTAADLALEAIGKAFPDSAGYTRWTKAASRHYTLASGVRVDLSDGEGKDVQIILTGGQTVEGTLHLGDWVLHLVSGGIQRDVFADQVARVHRLA